MENQILSGGLNLLRRIFNMTWFLTVLTFKTMVFWLCFFVVLLVVLGGYCYDVLKGTCGIKENYK